MEYASACDGVSASLWGWGEGSRTMLSGLDQRKLWMDRLRGVVGEGALSGVDVHGFVDERGHRRAVDRYLIGWLLGAVPGGELGLGLDLALWGALARGERPEVGWRGGVGSLQDWGEVSGGLASIEVWTERELSAIQALWTLGVVLGESGWCERSEAAARWCVLELQPDNATGHPWGLNAFVCLSCGGDVEAEMYAQTLLHNACVGLGRPGRFSSLVLLGSLRSLELTGRGC